MENIANYAERLNRVYAGGGHPLENLELMQKFLRKERHSGLTDATLASKYATLKVFSTWCTVPIAKMSEDDILDFLDYLKKHVYFKRGGYHHYSDTTIRTFKIVLRKFFIESGCPNLENVLKEHGAKKRDSIDRKDLLTKQEVEALINAALTPRDKAIIAMIYESGARRGELLSCRIKDLCFNENGVKVTFPKGKTGKRTVQLVYASSFLRMWVEVHPSRLSNGEPDPEAKLFVSLYGKLGNRGERVFEGLSDQGLYLQIQKIAKRIGLKKRVNPHSFRHARATDLAEHLTEQQLKKFLGWTPSSTMAAVYVHDPDTDNAILRMNGIEIEETHTDGLKIGKCPRCKELNPDKAVFCNRCGLPLTTQAASSIPLETANVSKEFLASVLMDPDMQIMIKNIFKTP